MKKLKKIPEFKSEAEERNFWMTHDTTDYIDWTKSKRTFFPNLSPSTETISLRLPEAMLMKIKVMANRIDVPYQSYIKTLLADKISEIEQRNQFVLRDKK